MLYVLNDLKFICNRNGMQLLFTIINVNIICFTVYQVLLATHDNVKRQYAHARQYVMLKKQTPVVEKPMQYKVGANFIYLRGVPAYLQL